MLTNTIHTHGHSDRGNIKNRRSKDKKLNCKTRFSDNRKRFECIRNRYRPGTALLWLQVAGIQARYGVAVAAGGRPGRAAAEEGATSAGL